ncbi:MAG: glycosyltransferase [Betaproteobacteria bacterium]|nr:glycosyltransferase [Betaproteobacteria bacterium]
MHESVSPILVEQIPVPKRSLRVAVVTETYPPEINGVATTAARFVDGLRLRNHPVQLIRPRQEQGEEPERNDAFQEVLTRGLPIPKYPNLRMGLPAKRALLKLWSLGRPDVVHIVTEGPLGWSALQAALKLRLPVVSDFRTNFHAYSSHYGVGWLRKPILAYLRKFHNRTEATLVPTEAMRASLAAVGFRNVRVVSRGVDTTLFSPDRRSAALRESWGVRPDDPVALYVGRLAPEKNLPLLVAAFDAMRAREPRAKLVVVGDGPAREDLRAHFPDAVHAGLRSGTDLATHFASGDIFLFPSLTETFGNVTTEAMASGLAIVAYDYAAAAEIMTNGQDGLLAPVDHADTFVRLASDLVTRQDRIRALGERARATARKRDWDSVVGELESVLLSASRTRSGFG